MDRQSPQARAAPRGTEVEGLKSDRQRAPPVNGQRPQLGLAEVGRGGDGAGPCAWGFALRGSGTRMPTGAGANGALMSNAPLHVIGFPDLGAGIFVTVVGRRRDSAAKMTSVSARQRGALARSGRGAVEQPGSFVGSRGRQSAQRQRAALAAISRLWREGGGGPICRRLKLDPSPSPSLSARGVEASARRRGGARAARASGPRDSP